MYKLIFILLSLLVAFSSTQPTNPTQALPEEVKLCPPGKPCWPSQSALDNLTQLLDVDSTGAPVKNRTLVWGGPGTPFPGAVGIFTPSSDENQPLYGAGKNLKGLYVRNITQNNQTCFVNNYVDEFCLVSMRNNPLEGWQPAFVAFPVDAGQVQLLVNFARNYSLPVCVLGTGHDFQNRHSCKDGLLIRTSLLKDKKWQPENNTIKIGSGLTIDEAHFFVSGFNRMVVSGWSPTVGIAGWTFGGGHGPYNPRYGLGSDNLVEVEVVTSDGKLVVANNNTNKDLWKALRGGGGSTWGVVTSMTIQTHPLPENGFTFATILTSGDFCGEGETQFDGVLDSYFNWTLTLDSNWGGLAFILTNFSMDIVLPPPSSQTRSVLQPPLCANNWTFIIIYHYMGASNETKFVETWKNLTSTLPQTANSTAIDYPNPSNFNLTTVEVITPVSNNNTVATDNNTDNSTDLNSVLVNRDNVANMVAAIKRRYAGCNAKLDCPQVFEIFQDLTGNLNSPQTPETSVNPGMRSGLFHLIFSGNTTDFLQLGDYSYFSESAYTMSDWSKRLWDEATYTELLRIKKKYDTIGLFQCRHCVGDSTP